MTCSPGADRWNDLDTSAQVERKVWTASATVRRYLHLLASGSPDCDWVTWVRAKHMPARVQNLLVLGCGTGWLERALLSNGGIDRIVACDYASTAVERAREIAAAQGLAIDYRVLDLEKQELPEGPFDVVVANDVLHHISGLETLYSRIRSAIRPGGRFVFSEYVGPDRFQYSDHQMDLINRYMRVLPDALRFDPCLKITLKRKDRIAVDRLLAEDPTEAVRSSDVLPLARDFFPVEAEYPYGGSLLNPLLYEIIVNFDESRPEDRKLLEMLCDAEDRLIRTGELSPDFFIFVGRVEPGA